MKNSKMLLDVNDKPPLLKWLLLSLQHVFAMFGATILVPILVNKAVGSEVLSIPVALISSGIGTLIYIVCTKGKSPVYLGSNLLIHFLPIALIINATKTYTIPTAIIPVKTLSFPLLTKATIIGVINANELPK